MSTSIVGGTWDDEDDPDVSREQLELLIERDNPMAPWAERALDVIDFD